MLEKLIHALVLISFFTINSGCGDDDDTEKIKIGLNVGVTGYCASLADTYVNSIQLAVSEINAAGGLLDGRLLETELLDTKYFDSGQADENVTTLVNNGAVAIVGPICSDECAEAVPAVKTNQVLNVVCGSNPALRTMDDDDYQFFHFPSDSLQGAKIAELVLAEGYSRVAIFHENTGYGQGLMTTFTESFEADAGTDAGAPVISATIAYSNDESNWSSIASQGLIGDPEVVLFFGYPTQVEAILLELDALSYDGYMIGADSTQDTSLADSVDITKWVGTAPGTMGSLFDGYTSRYEAMFGEAPQMFLAGVYDAVMAIALSIEASGSVENLTTIRDYFRVVTAGVNDAQVSPEDIADAIEKAGSGDINYQGASSTFEFDNQGDLTYGSSNYIKWVFDADGAISVSETL